MKFLIDNIITQRDLKVTKQQIGIADHADPLTDCKVCHLGHYLFIHVAGKISIKGLAAKMTGIGHAARFPIDRRTPSPGGNGQWPPEEVSQVLGKDL